MAKSDITYSFNIIDFYDRPEIFALDTGENVVYDYCLRQGAKNNIGMFVKERGVIAFFLKQPHDVVYNFFLKYPNIIGFCPDTHLIWTKKIYNYVNFNLTGDVWINRKDKETKEIKRKLNHNALNAKNNFITKINSTIRDDPIIGNHVFVKEWVKQNFHLLDIINDEVKSVNGNGDSRNFDKLLSSVEITNKEGKNINPYFISSESTFS